MRLTILLLFGFGLLVSEAFGQATAYDGSYTGATDDGSPVSFSITNGVFSSGGTSSQTVVSSTVTPAGVFQENYTEVITTSGSFSAPAITYSVKIDHFDRLTNRRTITQSDYQGTILIPAAGGANASGSFTRSVTPGAATSGSWSAAVPPPAPVITSAQSAEAQAGQLFAYQITTSRNNAASFAATGLPEGLTLDATTGAITSAPTVAGIFSVTLSATNAGGTGSLALSLVVTSAVTIETTVPKAHEGSGDRGIFTVTRQGINPSADLKVFYSVRGSAIGGVQYKTLSGKVIIPAGSAAAKIRVKALEDQSHSGNTAVKLTLLPGEGYTVGEPATAKVKVIDND